mmetsp:Transcript_10645/g.19238  ORF Transcript_10645/g.19238 Transcript_10645/m.19238 type:complete len:248 (-) Transcript_10645:906-1649(-)
MEVPSFFHTGSAEMPWSCRSGMAEHTSKTNDRQLFAKRDVASRAFGKRGGESLFDLLLFGGRPASRCSSTTVVGHLIPVPSSTWVLPGGSHAALASNARIWTGASSSGMSALSPSPSKTLSAIMISLLSILSRSLTEHSNDCIFRLNCPAMRNISRAQLTCCSSNSPPLPPALLVPLRLFVEEALVERVPMAMASSEAWLEMRISMEERVAGALYPLLRSSKRFMAASTSGNMNGAKSPNRSAASSK